METTAAQRKPPVQVQAALCFWAAGAALNLALWTSEADWHDWVVYPTLLILIALSALLLWFLYRGHNWARWLVVAAVSFRIFLALGRLHRADEITATQLLSLGLRAGCQVAALLLLFARAATPWFRPQNRAD